MGREDKQSAIAHEIANLAVHSQPVGRIVGDLSAVLQVLGVAEQHNALGLLANGCAAITDGGSCEGGALAVGCISICTCVLQLGCLRRIWAHEISFFVRNPELG
jgi:hypothetical protein